jgi:hypothetical protein
MLLFPDSKYVQATKVKTSERGQVKSEPSQETVPQGDGKCKYSDTLESELIQFQNPVRVPRQFFPFRITETGLIRSWVPRTRIFKMILTVNTLDFKVKF